MIVRPISLMTEDKSLMISLTSIAGFSAPKLPTLESLTKVFGGP